MREFLILAVLISGTIAYYDDNSDYWYSNADGVVIDNMMALFSKNRYNKTSLHNLRSFKELHFDLLDDDNRPTARSRKLRKKSKALLRYVPNIKLKQLISPGSSLKNAIVLKKTLAWPISQKTGRADCKIGDVTDFQCNRCACVTPILYVCSSKICSQTATISECVEGTKLESEDCNECFCLGGRPMCSLMNCPLEENNKVLKFLKNAVTVKKKNGVQCTEGDPISIDSCNTCWCSNGNILCTKIDCRSKMDFVKIIMPDKKDFCLEGTWYSPSNEPCKNCFCVDNNLSYCFIGVCQHDQKSISSAATEPSLPLHCKIGKRINLGRCTKCVCTSKKYWRCSRIANCKLKLKDGESSGVCEEGVSYSIGTKTSCYNCTCRNSLWERVKTKSRCSDYDDSRHLEKKATFVNTKGPCSSCYSYPRGNICATDVTCAKKFYEEARPVGKCTSNAGCIEPCREKDNLYGSCYKGKCVCF